MENQFFSLKRFGLLLRSDLRLNYKKYLLTLLGVSIVLFIYIMIQMPKENQQFQFGPNRYAMLFFPALIIMGAGILIGTSFSELKGKIKTSSYFMIPASIFEKYAAEFLIRIIFGLLVFLGIFWLDAQLARLAVFASYDNSFDPQKIDIFSYSMFFHMNDVDKFEIFMVISAIWTIGMFLFAVRLFFKRSHLVKMIISIFVFFYIAMGITWIIAHIAYPEMAWRDMDFPEVETGIFGLNSLQLLFLIAPQFTWIFMLIIGYFKLKEKQV